MASWSNTLGPAKRAEQRPKAAQAKPAKKKGRSPGKAVSEKSAREFPGEESPRSGSVRSEKAARKKSRHYSKEFQHKQVGNEFIEEEFVMDIPYEQSFPMQGIQMANPKSYVKDKNMTQLIEELFVKKINSDLNETIALIKNEDQIVMHYRLICVRRLEIVLQNFLEDPTLQLFMYGSCITGKNRFLTPRPVPPNERHRFSPPGLRDPNQGRGRQRALLRAPAPTELRLDKENPLHHISPCAGAQNRKTPPAL